MMQRTYRHHGEKVRVGAAPFRGAPICTNRTLDTKGGPWAA